MEANTTPTIMEANSLEKFQASVSSPAFSFLFSSSSSFWNGFRNSDVQLGTGKDEKVVNSVDGIRVYGFASAVMSSTQETSAIKFATKIAVYGERRVEVYNFSVDIVSGYPKKSGSRPQLTLLHTLPKFSHWVLDVCFLKGYLTHPNEESHFLAAIGCSDNSVHIWDTLKLVTVLKIQSPVRSLLYSMRLWGDNLEVLRIASGTIYNDWTTRIIRAVHFPIAVS